MISASASWFPCRILLCWKSSATTQTRGDSEALFYFLLPAIGLKEIVIQSDTFAVSSMEAATDFHRHSLARKLELFLKPPHAAAPPFELHDSHEIPKRNLAINDHQ